MSLASFGVRKPVAVNLFWLGLIVTGIIFGLTIRREFFPEMNPDQAMITMPYPGATPEEVEESMVRKVEDKLAELDEVDEMTTTIAESGAGIIIEFREGINIPKAMDEVQRAVDSLTDLPEESEKIQVALFEPKLPVIRVAVFGDCDEDALKRAVRGLKDDLRELPGMGEALIAGVRDYQIRVDVDYEATLRYGISLPAVSEAIRGWMKEVPGGTVRSSTGNVRIRTMGVQERAAAISGIVLRADATGKAVRVSDVAKVNESFIDEQILTRYDGKPASSLTIFKVGKQDIVTMAEMVRAYVDGRNGVPFEPDFIEGVRLKLQKPGLPQAQQPSPVKRLLAWELGQSSTRSLPVGAKIAASSDLARFVEGRLDLLTRNAVSGIILVFLTLLLFMSWRGAKWVATGVVTAIFGTLVLMAALDITLNLLTMFGLIIVLGMLVDDAIVISENIESWHYRGEPALSAAIKATEQVQWPVVGTVTTTIVAFIPLMFIKGRIGDLMGALPAVVTCALIVSLVEAVLILPSHMGHSIAKRERRSGGFFARLENRIEAFRNHLLMTKAIPAYTKVVGFCLRNRYPVLLAAVVLLIISLTMLAPFPNGRLRYEFLSSTDAETVVIDVRMPIGTPIERTDAIVKRIEEICGSLPEKRSVEVLIGQRTNMDSGQSEAFTPHVGQVVLELVATESRDRESQAIVDEIRAKLKGQLDEVERLTFTEISGGPGGPSITVRVRGDESDTQRMDEAAAAVKARLGQFPGVYDIFDNSDLGQMEMRVNLRPGAAAMGFTSVGVAQQVRGALYGLDAHTYAADQEDIDVRVRLDEATRRSLAGIDSMWLISPAGKPVPLAEIADIEDSATYASIKRVNRLRAVTVTAATAKGVSPESIVSQLNLDELRRQFPTLRLELAGRQEQQADAFSSMPTGFLVANLAIYIILAWLYSNYFQPFVVMTAIPFSLIGVVWGHYLLGYDVTFLSAIGFVALAGIVVNNSLIVLEFYNTARGKGESVYESLLHAGASRVRAIFLTSVTTILGLTPLMLEQSFQAKFLIPMAITLSMGLAASAVMVLTVFPCIIMILDDIKGGFYFLWNGQRRQAGPAVPAEDVGASQAS